MSRCPLYEETAAQGRWHRPQLKKLLDELQPGQVIVVASLDRFAGSLTDLVQILNQIQSRGARFRSIAESLDTTRTTSDCAVQMLGVLAAFDRAQLKQRTSEGQRSARQALPCSATRDPGYARGGPLGGGFSPSVPRAPRDYQPIGG